MNALIKERCPACAELGRDSTGDNLSVFPQGKFHCIAAGKDRAHNRRIIELRPELGKNENRYSAQSERSTSNCIPATKRIDWLSLIRIKFPTTLYDLWDSSPIRIDEELNEPKAFLRLFPADAILWVAPEVFQSGKPEHAVLFRTRAEWEADTFNTPGTRIAPSSFRAGSYRRRADDVVEHLFVVIETDEIGEGKLYSGKDEFCSLLRWLCEACAWQLAAVIDSGGKSLHAWFRNPGADEVEKIRKLAVTLGLDAKFSEPAQPWRLPGVQRERSDTRQCLVYLEARL